MLGKVFFENKVKSAVSWYIFVQSASQLLKKDIEFVHPSLKGFVYRSKTRFRCLRKKLAAKALVVYRARSVQIGHAPRHCPRCQEDICRLLLFQKWR